MADTGKKLWSVTIRHAEESDASTSTVLNLVAPTLAEVERKALGCARDLGLRRVRISMVASRGTLDEPARRRARR